MRGPVAVGWQGDRPPRLAAGSHCRRHRAGLRIGGSGGGAHGQAGVRLRRLAGVARAGLHGRRRLCVMLRLAGEGPPPSPACRKRRQKERAGAVPAGMIRALVLALVFCGASFATPKPADVLIILTDQWSPRYLSWDNPQVRTPNLDRLA